MIFSCDLGAINFSVFIRFRLKCSESAAPLNLCCQVGSMLLTAVAAAAHPFAVAAAVVETFGTNTLSNRKLI